MTDILLWFCSVLLGLALVILAPFVAYQLQQLRQCRPVLRRPACMGGEEQSAPRQMTGRCSGASFC
jgi:hypothetical protein